MKNELKEIIDKYFPKEYNTIHYHVHGDENRVLNITRFFEYIKPYEEPDAYAVDGNTLLILEHFGFDSSDKIKLGSQQRRAEAIDNQLFQQIEASKKGVSFHNTIEANYSVENYRNNATYGFMKHYSKLNTYKGNLSSDGLIKPNTEVITAFFIEDTTLLGNVFETDNWDTPTSPLYLPFCDFFLDLFEQNEKIDCAFCGSLAYQGYRLWFIDRTMISQYRRDQIDTEKISLVNFTPKHVGYKVLIPDGLEISHDDETSNKR